MVSLPSVFSRALNGCFGFEIQKKSAVDGTFLPVITSNNLQNNRLLWRLLQKEPKEGINDDLSRGRGKETNIIHHFLHAAHY